MEDMTLVMGERVGRGEEVTARTCQPGRDGVYSPPYGGARRRSRLG